MYGKVLLECSSSYASIAHRPQLRNWHTHVLCLRRDQGDLDGPGRGYFSTTAEYEQWLQSEKQAQDAGQGATAVAWKMLEEAAEGAMWAAGAAAATVMQRS